MRNDVLIDLCMVIIIILVFLFYVDGRFNVHEIINNKTDTVFTTKVDTLWKDTVITEREFVPKLVVKTKVDTLFKENGDTVELVSESKRFDKSLVLGEDTADVQVYTFGIKTSLDSLKMRLRTHHEVVTNTVEVTKYIEKRKRLIDRVHIQPQVTSGYDFVNKQWGVMCGIGVGIDL